MFGLSRSNRVHCIDKPTPQVVVYDDSLGSRYMVGFGLGIIIFDRVM